MTGQGVVITIIQVVTGTDFDTLGFWYFGILILWDFDTNVDWFFLSRKRRYEEESDSDQRSSKYHRRDGESYRQSNVVQDSGDRYNRMDEDYRGRDQSYRNYSGYHHSSNHNHNHVHSSNHNHNHVHSSNHNHLHSHHADHVHSHHSDHVHSHHADHLRRRGMNEDMMRRNEDGHTNHSNSPIVSKYFDHQPPSTYDRKRSRERSYYKSKYSANDRNRSDRKSEISYTHRKRKHQRYQLSSESSRSASVSDFPLSASSLSLLTSSLSRQVSVSYR